ncbi:hypothetical protein [Chitinophaga sancti]|uniref:hypothetical protein n=1 Tax=Chitinophaga sancti TaxID=1004 RepID=UPI003F7AEB23
MRRISILMALAIAGCHQENKTSQQEDTATTSSTTLSGAANPGAAFESKKVQEGVKVLFDTVIATKQTEAFIKAKYPYNTPGIAFTHNDEDITGDSTTTRVSSFHIPGYDITYKFEFKEEFEAGKSTIFVNKKQITHIIDESGSTVNDCGFISWGGSPMETCTINGQQYVILSGTNEWASGMFTNLCYGIIVPLAENNTTAYLVSSYGQLSFYPKGVANSAKLTFIQGGRLEEDEEEDELDSVRIQIAQLDIRQ